MKSILGLLGGAFSGGGWIAPLLLVVGLGGGILHYKLEIAGLRHKFDVCTTDKQTAVTNSTKLSNALVDEKAANVDLQDQLKRANNAASEYVVKLTKMQEASKQRVQDLLKQLANRKKDDLANPFEASDSGRAFIHNWSLRLAGKAQGTTDSDSKTGK